MSGERDGRGTELWDTLKPLFESHWFLQSLFYLWFALLFLISLSPVGNLAKVED